MSSKRKNEASNTLKLVKDQEILDLKRIIEKLEKKLFKFSDKYKKYIISIDQQLNGLKTNINNLHDLLSNFLSWFNSIQEENIQQNLYIVELLPSMSYDDLKINFEDLLKENRILLKNNCEISKILMKYNEDNKIKQEKINHLEVQLRKVELKSQKEIGYLKEAIEKRIIDMNYNNEIKYLRDLINRDHEIIDELNNYSQRLGSENVESCYIIDLNERLNEENKELKDSLNRMCFA